MATPLLVAAMAAADSNAGQSAVDPADPANSGDGSGNDAYYAENGFPRGDGSNSGGKEICTNC